MHTYTGTQTHRHTVRENHVYFEQVICTASIQNTRTHTHVVRLYGANMTRGK